MLAHRLHAIARDEAEALLAGPGAAFSAAGYTRTLIRAEADAELWLLTWMPGQATPIHDHGDAHSATVVLSGELIEERYELDANGEAELMWVRTRHALDVDLIEPTTIHRVRAGARPAITLHLYAPRSSQGREFTAAPVRLAGRVANVRVGAMQPAAQAIVVGGGFSGAMTAVQLAARGVDAMVVEPGALGRGIAYADGPRTLLLNTPAWAMSALPDRPDDFTEWLARRGDRRVFAPRATYGDYVIEKLDRRTAHVEARALDVEPRGDGYAVHCSDGTTRHAAHVILACGNAPPRTPRMLRGFGAYHANPYRAMCELPPSDKPIALLGTGLTALDAITTLRHRGHTGTILALSRRGLVPARHPGVKATDPTVLPRELVERPSVTALLGWWRATPVSLTAKIDAIRPHLPALWRGLSHADRARFLRHLRPHWEIVRHRAPGTVHDLVQGCRDDGTVEIVKGSLTGAWMIPDGLHLVVGDRHIETSALLNCTGPERDLARMPDPLVRNLLHRGLVGRDPLGLGAAWLAPGLHAVGPWRVADSWESTAVGELRAQAAEVAQTVSEHLGQAAPGTPEQAGALLGAAG